MYTHWKQRHYPKDAKANISEYFTYKFHSTLSLVYKDNHLPANVQIFGLLFVGILKKGNQRQSRIECNCQKMLTSNAFTI